MNSVLTEKLSQPYPGKNTQSPGNLRRTQKDRFRSVTHKQGYYRAAFFCAIHYFGIVAGLTTLVVFILSPSQFASRILLACIAFIVVTWMIAFFKRRAVHCPLCKGTPLFNTGALPHAKATRIWPFNHGVSATLSIIATHTFRCMYCGTAFDLMKKPTHLVAKDSDTADTTS
jgi:hypothetical protein